MHYFEASEVVVMVATACTDHKLRAASRFLIANS